MVPKREFGAKVMARRPQAGPATTYRVFLSATSRDLGEYRKAVLEAIARFDDCQAISMENFGARAASAIDFVAERIGMSDLLVGLLGLCYGSSPRGQPPSFTEREYEAAKASGKPCLMFVFPANFPVAGVYRESDEQWQRQQSFRNRVEAEDLRSDAFDSPGKLASEVTLALHNWLSKQRSATTIEAKPAAERASTEPSDEAPLGPNPYRGLEAFRKEDAPRFFGREAVVDQLWNAFLQLHVTRSDSEAPMRLLAILGASGSGKSSVAQAGLLAELEKRPLPGRPAPLEVVFTPEARPLESLAVALAREATKEFSPAKKAAEFEDVLRTRGSHDGLRYLADRMLDVGGAGLILLVDQFEELYSLCDAEQERAAFIGNLLHAAREPRGNVSIVLTLRSDFLGPVNQHPELSRLIARQNVVVPVMGEDDLRRAIEEPARNAGREIDPGTVQLLLEQTRGREGALPLLEFVLTHIWDGFAKGVPATVTVSALGDVGGALASQAQAVYDLLGPEERDIARRAFLAMVRLGEGTKDLRQPARVSEILSRGHGGPGPPRSPSFR
jgi:Domain of unknown function (DUF4062)